jgi:hypothetical protein
VPQQRVAAAVPKPASVDHGAQTVCHAQGRLELLQPRRDLMRDVVELS